MNIQNNRVIFIKGSGTIVFQTGEAVGDVVPHGEWGTLAYIDVPYGSVDYSKSFIKAVDLKTLQPVIENLPEPEPTEEQIRIKQLQEDILLLKTDSVVGGIL